MNQGLGVLGLDKHPDKTLIGRIERGFDFLGYHFGPDGLCVALKTVEKFVERAIRLYEQERAERDGSAALGMYVRRWNRGLKGELGGLLVSIPLILNYQTPKGIQCGVSVFLSRICVPVFGNIVSLYLVSLYLC